MNLEQPGCKSQNREGFNVFVRCKTNHPKAHLKESAMETYVLHKKHVQRRSDAIGKRQEPPGQSRGARGPRREAGKAEPPRWRWAEPCQGREQEEGQDPESHKVSVTGMALNLMDTEGRVRGKASETGKDTTQA